MPQDRAKMPVTAPDAAKSVMIAPPVVLAETGGIGDTLAFAVTDPALGAAAVALDMFAIPAFLLRPNCEILAASSTGPTLLQASRAFYAHHGKLAVRRSNDEQALTAAVARVAARGQVELLRFLTRQEEASALMRIQPLPNHPLVIVAIAELRAPSLLAAGWSRAAFGFSAPHAALAESLALGHSLADFAATERLPIGTVRTRLKKLLLQTGTSSQASLAAMLQRASVIMSGAEKLAAPAKGRGSQGL
jgi:hypothetical protein